MAPHWGPARLANPLSWKRVDRGAQPGGKPAIMEKGWNPPVAESDKADLRPHPEEADRSPGTGREGAVLDSGPTPCCFHEQCLTVAGRLL